MVQGGLIIVGNSGVGKSFLANIIIGEDNFLHEISPVSCTSQTECHYATINNNLTVAVFNIPGLIENDQKAIERNKTEIQRAFEIQPNSIILYVFGNSGGRIRDEDVVAFQALDKAYHIKRESLSFIVNDLSPNRPANYEGKTILCLQTLLDIKEPIRVSFLDRIDPCNIDAKKFIQTKLLDAIEKCIPTVHTKHAEIELQKEEISQLEAEIHTKQEEYDKQTAVLSSQIATLQVEYNTLLEKLKASTIKEIHHYTNPIAKALDPVVKTVNTAVDDVSREVSKINLTPAVKEVNKTVNSVSRAIRKLW